MIRVKKVVGESFDLETGDGTGKALMLANDRGDSVLVEVDEETVQAVLELMAADMRVGNSSRTVVPKGVPVTTDTVRVTQEDLDNGFYGPESFGGQDYESGPASDEDDYDPGEQYGDSSSGLPSI